MIECVKCKQLWPQDRYSKGKKHCKKCAAESFRSYWHKTSRQKIVDLPTEKTCSVCQQLLPITEFYIRRGRNTPIYRCKKCNHAASKHNYANLTNAEKSERLKKNKTWRDSQIKNGNLKVFFTQKLCSYKSSAKKHNLPFDLTTEYLINLFEKQNRKCYYTNSELTLVSFRGSGHRAVTLPDYHYQASLDKLDPDKGYVKGNVVWCGWLVNTCKNMLTETQFYEFCETVISNKLARKK